jgi:hypothetical protein|tara:strand:+ start:1735 stop:2124 length:390 start_codon:yes stop_codon:yes gene_type:complete
MGKNSRHCWLKRGKRKEDCRANKHKRKNQHGATDEWNTAIADNFAKANVTRSQSDNPALPEGAFGDAGSVATVSFDNGSSMSAEAYDAKMAHNKDLTASARLHYLENDEAAYHSKHPVLRHNHYSKHFS